MAKTPLPFMPTAPKAMREGSSKRKAPDIRYLLLRSTPSTRLLTQSSDLAPEFVSIIVTDTTEFKTFSFHRDLACFWSSFFRGAFTSGLSESITLTDTTIAAAAVLVRWMYTGNIHDRDGQLPSSVALYDLWLLADKLVIPSLQNATIIAIEDQRMSEKKIRTDMAAKVYEKTSAGCPLRKFLVYQIAFGLTFRGFEEDLVQLHRYPVELQTDLLLALKKEATTSKAAVADMSIYFVPTSEVEKEETA